MAKQLYFTDKAPSLILLQHCMDTSIFGATALMMEAARTSETSVNLYQTTRRNITEESHVHTRRRENLKSHAMKVF
jgi:hypothetical protein